MGDRSNIAIVQRNGRSRVYFYAHWAGSRSFRAVEHGLRSGRTRDAAYLGRIIFQNLLAGDDSELSFGISNQVIDNEHDIVVVHPAYDREPLVWLESDAGVPITPKVTASAYVEVMESFDPEDLHPDDELLVERLKAVAGVPA